jgi:hypothetical protein
MPSSTVNKNESHNFKQKITEKLMKQLDAYLPATTSTGYLNSQLKKGVIKFPNLKLLKH